MILTNIEIAIKKLQGIRKRPVLVIAHETLETRHSYICQKQLIDKHFDELDIIIQSPGGDISPAYGITKLLRIHADKCFGLVPRYAKSAATLICLGMNEIVLSSLGELGPLDTQQRENVDGNGPSYESALNRSKALEQIRKFSIETFDILSFIIVNRSGLKMREAVELSSRFTADIVNPLFSQMDPKKIGESARALDIGAAYGVRILNRYLGFDKEEAEKILQRLVYNYPSHGFILDVEELEDLGIKARYADAKEEAVLQELYYLLEIYPDDIMKLYPFELESTKPKGTRRRKGVKNDKTVGNS